MSLKEARRDVTQLHRDAMELADAADLAQRQGRAERAVDLNRQAFEKEREATHAVGDHDDLEPNGEIVDDDRDGIQAMKVEEYAREAADCVTVADVKDLRDHANNNTVLTSATRKKVDAMLL